MSNEEAKENNRDELIREIKMIRALNSSLCIKINSLESRIHTKDCEVILLEDKLGRATSKIQFLESEKTCLQRKYGARIKSLENERRRNDIFNRKVMSTSKTKKESLMIQEMDSLRSVNKTLLGIIDILSESIGFDNDVVKAISKAADGVEDNILRLFVDSLKSRDTPSNCMQTL